MCSAKNSSPKPTFTIRSESGGGTTIEPELLTMENGSSVMRSLKVEMGPYGEPVRVTAELLPSSVLLKLTNPFNQLIMDGQPIAAITLKDGTVVRFG